MPDDAPNSIGPYTILREIGRGGMGVVYLARDTKLERDVAIKCLPAELAAEPERRARFEREARTLASMNHPGIAAIYGVEEAEGRLYLVLEHVPGDTLDEVLARGPIPVREALPLAKQIAEAVESAHECGIIHRDLKPANIKFVDDERLKVLDFGLAKALGESPSWSGDLASSPTYVPTDSSTMPGVVMGSAGYLSPEQARGRTVDKRSDVFSFGCVLYEMLVGRSIFPGETVTDSLGATLHKEPHWEDLPADTPPTIALLLRRCLTKDRRRRLHDIADARIEIEAAIHDPTSSSLNLAASALAAAHAPSGRGGRVGIVVALVAGAAITAAAFLAAPAWQSPDPPPLTRLSLDVPKPPYPFGSRFVVSRDGRTIVARVQDEEDEIGILRRRLDEAGWTSLASFRGAMPTLTLSPDSRSIAYIAEDGLRRAPADGGPSARVCDATLSIGMCWSLDGWIYFTEIPARERDDPMPSRLMRVPERGGEPEVIAMLDADADAPGAMLHSPQVLTDGRTVLCAVTNPGNEMETEIRAYSVLDGTAKTILESASQPHYASTGHLLFVRESTLMAVPFDPATLETGGAAVPLIDGIATMRFLSLGAFAISDDGTLFHVQGEATSAQDSVLALDADGNRSLLSTFNADNLSNLRVSPDGSRVAMEVFDPTAEDSSTLWVVDLARDIPQLLTPESGAQDHPIWSPDGTWIYYFWDVPEEGATGVYRRRSDSSGEPELLVACPKHLCLASLDADRNRIFATDSQGVEADLVTIDLEAGRVEPWLATTAAERGISLSPNGRWVAYSSSETGNPELYVRSVTGEQKHRISRHGARSSVFWSPDGATLYYTGSTGPERAKTMLLSVAVTAGHEKDAPADAEFDWQAPIPLFECRPGDDLLMHPDGVRFVTTARWDESEATDSFQIQVTLNFFEELKRRVPVEGQSRR